MPDSVGPRSWPARLLWVCSGLAVLAVGAVVLVRYDSPPGPGPDPGRTSVTAFAQEYLKALNENDQSRLGAILGRAESSIEVQGRLSTYGGRGLRDPDFTVENEFPRVYQITIKAHTAAGIPSRIYEVVEWDGTRWNIAPFVSPSTRGTATK